MLLLFLCAAAALCILLLQWLLTGSKAFSFWNAFVLPEFYHRYVFVTRFILILCQTAAPAFENKHSGSLPTTLTDDKIEENTKCRQRSTHTGKIKLTGRRSNRRMAQDTHGHAGCNPFSVVVLGNFRHFLLVIFSFLFLHLDFSFIYSKFSMPFWGFFYLKNFLIYYNNSTL